jgi:hypothetical protein
VSDSTTSSSVTDSTTSSSVPDTTPTTEAPEPDLLPLSVNPATIHPGETSTISGEGCLSDGDPGVVAVLVFNPDDLENPIVEDEVDANDDGTWSDEFTALPEDAGHSFIAAAACFDNDEDVNLVVEYDIATITVVGTPSTAPAPPPVLGPVAPAAVAVSAEPTFTG